MIHEAVARTFARYLGATGLTVTGYVVKSGGRTAFGEGSSVAEISGGWYLVTVAAADMTSALGVDLVAGGVAVDAFSVVTELSWTPTKAGYVDEAVSAAKTLTSAYDAAKTALTVGGYTAPPSTTDIATAVWAAGTRTLSSFGSLVSDITTAVWGAANRTLTAGLLTAQQVWEYATRTITSGGITAQQVWEYETRTITSGGGGATPQEVWEYTTRSLTDKANFTLTAGERTSIGTAVWATTTRTLTSLSALATSIGQYVWQYTTRALTAVGSVQYVSPVLNSDTLEIYRGSAYGGTDAPAAPTFTFTQGTPTTFRTLATYKLDIGGTLYTLTCTIDGTTVTLTCANLTSANTTAMSGDTYRIKSVIDGSNSSVLAEGRVVYK